MNPESNLESFDRDDEATASELRAAFGSATFDRPVNTIAVAAPVAVPSARRSLMRPGLMIGVAAAAAAVLASVVMPVGGAPSAWAANPSAVSAAEKKLATDACSAAMPGAGGVKLVDQGSTDVVVPNGGSGQIAVPAPTDGSKVEGTVPEGSMAPPPFPTELPPLAAVDRRGDKALAVFENNKDSVACMLSIKDGAWETTGMMFGLLPGDPNAGTVAGAVSAVMGSTSVGPSGASNNIAAGQVPDGVSRVTLTFADGTEAEATVAEGIYAAWFPAELGNAPQKVTMYDAAGNPTVTNTPQG